MKFIANKMVVISFSLLFAEENVAFPTFLAQNIQSKMSVYCQLSVIIMSIISNILPCIRNCKHKQNYSVTLKCVTTYNVFTCFHVCITSKHYNVYIVARLLIGSKADIELSIHIHYKWSHF